MTKRPAKKRGVFSLGKGEIGTSSTVCGDEQSAHFLAFSVRNRSPFPASGEGEARRWRAGIIVCPCGAGWKRSIGEKRNKAKSDTSAVCLTEGKPPKAVPYNLAGSEVDISGRNVLDGNFSFISISTVLYTLSR